MSDIFESQSDAILAFEKVEVTEPALTSSLNFIFCNLKCLEFFAYDFMQRGIDIDQTDRSPLARGGQNPIEMKLFTPINFDKASRVT